MYNVYLLQSTVDGSYYIGSSSNPARRLVEHNSGKSPYTSKKKPWIIVYTEKFHNKTEALIREKFLKKQRNKQFYERLIKEYNQDMIQNAWSRVLGRGREFESRRFRKPRQERGF